MNSRVGELERLADLYERGSLSASEFAAAKAALLGSTPELDKAEGSRRETDPSTGSPVSMAGPAEESSPNFPMWAVFRPIRTDDEARSLLKAGYYAAVVASIQGVVLLSKYPVYSNTDNVAIVIVLLVGVSAFVYAARKVSAQRSVMAAWCLLAVVGFQMFGIITGRGFGIGTLILGATGVIVGIQAVRATQAYRTVVPSGGSSFADPSL